MELAEAEHCYRKTRIIRQQLIQHFGPKFSRYIDSEMHFVEEMVAQGLTFNEICSRMQAKLPGRALTQSLDLSRTPQLSGFSHGIQRRTPAKQLSSNIFNERHRMYDELNTKRKQFEEDTELLTRKFEQARESNFPLPYSYEYYAKLDEVKALEAQQLNNQHVQAIELQRSSMKRNAERDNELCIAQQIQEKLTRRNAEKAQEKQVRANLDDKELRLRYYESLRAERDQKKKQSYAKALDDQLRLKHKMQEEFNRLKSIEQSLASRGSHTPFNRSFNSTGGSNRLAQLGSSMVSRVSPFHPN